jgi:hypothetical protein
MILPDSEQDKMLAAMRADPASITCLCTLYFEFSIVIALSLPRDKCMHLFLHVLKKRRLG